MTNESIEGVYATTGGLLGREERPPVAAFLPMLSEPIGKRELFAAMAMAGLLAAESPIRGESMAENAVRYADLLLAALKEKAP